jgi:hypothetical protein
MTRIDIHTIDSSPAESREGLEALHDKFGTTLNIFGANGCSPTPTARTLEDFTPR